MKRKLQIMTSASAGSIMAFTALAQETPSAKTGGTEITQERSTGAMRAERLGRAEKASELTTAQIRKEIIAGKTMSVNAKNVKIITNQGRVTLRGPVNTAEEKRLIGDIAARIANSVNVDNQLEVKRATAGDN